MSRPNTNGLLPAWQRYKRDYPRLFSLAAGGPGGATFCDGVSLDPDYRAIKDLAWQVSDLNLRSFSRFQAAARQAGAGGRPP